MFHSKHLTWRRPAACAVGVVAAGAALAACGSSSSGGSAAAGGSGGGGGKTIVFVAGQANNVFYETMKGPAEAEAKKLGYKLIWNPPSQFSAESQTPILQSLIAKHPAALVVTPDDPDAMASPIEQYVRDKIPVITVDTGLSNTSLVKSAITSDNVQGGQLAAKFIGQKTGGKGGTFAMGADTSTHTTVVRGQQFGNAIKSKYPNMKLYPTEYDQQNESQAATLTASTLTAHHDITGVFGTNNDAVEGIARAVKEQGKTGKIDVVGYDADPTEAKLLKDGEVSALIIQQPAKEARMAVQFAADAIEGKPVKKSVQLPNIIATKADANKPSIAKYYYGG